MLRAAAAPTDRTLAGTNASGTVLPPQSGWRINEGWFSAILLIVMVLSTIWSIHSAGWVEGTQVLFRYGPRRHRHGFGRCSTSVGSLAGAPGRGPGR